MRLNPYLNFNGQCEEAFKFYEKCLSGKIEMMLPHAGTPAAGHVPAEWQNKIMHARLTMGENVLMGSDVPPDRYKVPSGFSVTLQIKNPAEAERIFSALSEKGTINMPIRAAKWCRSI